MPTRSTMHLRAVASALVTACAIVLGTARAQESGWEMRVCADPASLPFSSADERGFENRIAAILADELGASLTYDWHYLNSDLVKLELRAGNCDVIMGVPDGYEDLLTTVAYYQSPYVLVYRPGEGHEISSFDDPVLRTLRIGVQSNGIPPQTALVERGLGTSIVAGYGTGYGSPDHLDQIVKAVANGEIDLGLSWGPQVGYYVDALGLDLTVVPITPEFDPSSLPMTVPMTIAVRPGDTALRDALNIALAKRWSEIQAVLDRYHVPVEPLQAPLHSDVSPSQGLLRVGLVVPTKTGPSAVPGVSLYDVVGQGALMGAQLASEAIGGRGGGGGVELELSVASSPSAAAAARSAHRLLAVDGVAALVGGLGDSQAETLSQIAERAGVPFLNVGAPDGSLRSECLRSTFNVAAGAGMYLDAMAEWFTKQGHTRWFIVHEDTEGGAELRDQALRAVEAAPGASVVGSAAVMTGEPNYGTALQALRRSGADLVLLLVNGPDQIAFMAQQESVGPRVAVAPFPYALTQTRDFLGAARVRADSQGLGFRVALWEATLEEPESTALNDRFVSRWGQPMDPAAWASYAAVKILHDAAVAADTTHPEALGAYLASPGAAFEVGKGTPLSFESLTHQLSQPLYVIEIDPDARLSVMLQDQLDLASLAAVVRVAPEATSLPPAEPATGSEDASQCQP